MSQQNGLAVPDTSNIINGRGLPVVVGINFGNTYASIAVLTKDGLAECIATEDGERQIACAVSFHGEEIYIGNQAKPQLVKNSENTITNFRNLLGKKFSEIPQDRPNTSAPVIQHPDQPDEPAYKVSILQPAPTPLPTLKSAVTSPAVSHVPTPRSEPIPAERILTVSEVNTIFLKSLIGSAQDFLGKPVEGAVISVPEWFDDNARVELLAVAENAGVKVLQLVEETAAASLWSTLAPSDGLSADRTSLVVDVGQSSISLALQSIRDGLVYSLTSSYVPGIGGELIDQKLMKFFAKEFTKKTKVPLTVCPATDKADLRAEAKLRLAVEHTKRTLSASPGAATCSVESLKDGVDFTGSINRLRFDLEVRTVYDEIFNAAKTLLENANFDPLYLDEIIYAGGSSSLAGLDETFFAKGFPDTIITPFTSGTVIGGGAGDPTTVIARGCALQAKVLAQIPENESETKDAFKPESAHGTVKALAKTIALLFPRDNAEGKDVDALGGQWIVGIPRETPLPCRRIYKLGVQIGESVEDKKIGFEVWEVSDDVKVDKIKLPKLDDDEPEEEEEEEVEEVREKLTTKQAHLATVVLPIKHALKEKNRWKTQVEIQIIVEDSGAISISMGEIGPSGTDTPIITSIPAISQ